MPTPPDTASAGPAGPTDPSGLSGAAAPDAPARRRRNPLPELGFGAAQLGNLYRVTTDDEARGAVDAAWEGGIRMFDTAPHYGIGTSERRLGALLADRPREEYVLSTKVGRLLVPGPGDGDDMEHEFAVPDDHIRVWDMSGQGIRRSHAESLERLGLDRVDILYLHDPEEGPTEQAFAEALPTLAAMREEGLISCIGVGSKDVDVLTRAVRTGLLDVVMVSGRYTLLGQPAAEQLLPACLDHEVEVVAVSVFNSGILSRPTVPDRAKYEYGDAPVDLLQRARELAALAVRHGVELPELAIRYPLRHPAISSVVLGMRTADQVRQNIERCLREIPEEIWEQIDA
ncbi:aldo/keto reductase [Brachybacterium alimentarium]|uniref:aldo/keto reductase n=1 Tax=Brachybacterium alimentarium TaxID=47845 RepID=UPI000DF39854|nr:aldo/keto reductase [Brachybacterium alimentarium]RCS76546.1 aldo/keto reductase [Brachybacterium alimentarium]